MSFLIPDVVQLSGTLCKLDLAPCFVIDCLNNGYALSVHGVHQLDSRHIECIDYSQNSWSSFVVSVAHEVSRK